MRKILMAAALTIAAGGPLGAQEMSPRATFVLHCAGCHRMDGQGSLPGGIPAFPDSVGHIANTDEGRTYIMHVPGVLGASLTDAEIAEVVNYILETWSDGAPRFDEAEVTRRRAIPVPDVVRKRREIVAELAEQGIPLSTYPWP
ncbi:cytochrome c (plasmid) [Salipiger sp. H15]|uniref:Cytochrome c n=1 Tax=Alloyangia sp. H15 TaxID=3029062 RepID=A0AAU8APT4_9RHOB